MTTWLALAALLCAALAGGCKKSADKPAAADTPADTSPPPRDKPEVVKKPVLIPEAEVRDLMDRWLAAQNQGDFAAYSALYADGFRGVRRSGKKAVHLDRKGWLADRGRMFKREMTVTITDVEISVGPRSARIHFTQEWQSGAYHDIGPKAIVVEKAAKGLRITREEMLSSLLLATAADLPLVSELFAPLYSGMLVLSEQADATWATGAPELLRGHIVEQDPACETDPPDYEADHNRYWECQNTHPDNVSDHFVASRPVNGKRVPAELAAWQGKKLALYSAQGRVCEATVDELVLWAEETSTVARVLSSEGDDVAAKVLAEDTVLLANLKGTSCNGAVFARAADLPAPPQWTLKAPDPALQAAIKRELASVVDYVEIIEGSQAIGPGPAPEPKLLAVEPPGKGRRFAIAWVEGAINCHEDGFVMVIWEVKGSSSSPRLELVFEEGDQAMSPLAAADMTGEGIPVMVVDDGYLVWNQGSYAHVRAVAFPEQVMDECHCECE